MNSTVLRLLAVILALGAIVTAAIGYRLSTKQAPAVVAPPPVTYPQVVAARDLPAGRLLTAEDVRLEPQVQRESQAYESTGKVIGKLTLNAVPAGTLLMPRHFPRLGVAAQGLQPGERGVAIKVSEVIGVGGFLGPGDHVDVLLFIPGTQETGNISSSQVVLRDVRVLAYGDQLSQADAEPTMVQKITPGSDANKNEAHKPPAEQERSSRSAILAVAEKDVARLMLADHSGQVRLALRGAEPPQAVASAQDSQYLRLAELASPTSAAAPLAKAQVAQPPAPPRKVAPRVAKTKKPAQANTTRVIVHRGEKQEVVTVKN